MINDQAIAMARTCIQTLRRLQETINENPCENDPQLQASIDSMIELVEKDIALLKSGRAIDCDPARFIAMLEPIRERMNEIFPKATSQASSAYH